MLRPSTPPLLPAARRPRAISVVTGALFVGATLACMPPPTTYGLRSSGDAPDKGETRVSGTVGALTFASGASEGGGGGAIPHVLVDEDIGITDHISVGLSQGAALNGAFSGEAELVYDAELDGPADFGASAGAGMLLRGDTPYVRPYAGVVVGYEVANNASPYLGVTINPVFDGVIWWQVHPGFVYDPGPGEGVRFGADVTVMAATGGAGPTIVTPQVFVGGTFAGREARAE
jgi:hypothetical protein